MIDKIIVEYTRKNLTHGSCGLRTICSKCLWFKLASDNSPQALLKAGVGQGDDIPV